MLKEEYKDVQKEFNLPSFDEMEYEFDLLQADPEYPLKAIRKQMQDKIEFIADIFSDILQPSPESVSQMIEIEHIDEANKSKVLELYKELQYFLRKSHVANLTNEEKVNAEFIKEFFPRYLEIKKDSLPILEKLMGAWKAQYSKKEKVGYFG